MRNIILAALISSVCLTAYTQSTSVGSPNIIRNGTWCNGTLVNGYANLPGALATNALIAYWKLDETSGNFIDATGHGWTATVSGPLVYGTPGIIGTSVQGTNSGATVYASTSLNRTSDTNFTFSCWVNINGAAYGNHSDCIFTMRDVSNTNGWVIEGAGAGYFYIQGVGAGGGGLLTAFVQTNSTWQHLAVVRSNSVGFVYTNGTLEGLISPFTPKPGPATAMLLNDGYTPGPGTGFSGRLDEVGYWATNLTQTQVQYLAATNPFSKF